MPDNTHSRLSASQAKRWMRCPGCIKLIEENPLPERKSSKYADEGTAAHSLAEEVLASDDMGLSLATCDLEGKEIEVNGEFWTVTEDMAEMVQKYVNTVRAASSDPENKTWIESKFQLTDAIGGTNDAMVFDPVAGKLSVFDLKYGRGVLVFPEKNPQLMIYAIGALSVLSPDDVKKIKKVQLTIVQPRARDAEGRIVRSWTTTVEDLQQWWREAILPAVEKINSKNGELCAGEWCRFCPAIAVCPEQQKDAMESCKADFGLDGVVNLPEVSSIDPAKLVQAIALGDRLSAWVKSAQAYLQELAEKGQKVPGMKLVLKETRRKWKDAKLAEKFISEKLGADAYEKKLIPLTKAEKLLKKEDGFEELWIKPEAGYSLVPECDARKEVNPNCLEFVEAFDFM